jgi:hypothetical protein
MWVRRRDPSQEHQCELPTREVTYKLPKSPLPGVKSNLPDTHTETVVDGAPGDVWRCDACGRLWECRVDPSDWRIFTGWYPAPWWLRLRYRGR